MNGKRQDLKSVRCSSKFWIENFQWKYKQTFTNLKNFLLNSWPKIVWTPGRYFHWIDYFYLVWVHFHWLIQMTLVLLKHITSFVVCVVLLTLAIQMVSQFTIFFIDVKYFRNCIKWMTLQWPLLWFRYELWRLQQNVQFLCVSQIFRKSCASSFGALLNLNDNSIWYLFEFDHRFDLSGASESYDQDFSPQVKVGWV